MEHISAAEARNFALAAQGFGQARPSAVTRNQLFETLRMMAVVQLDSVNVVQRSHYLPFFARLGPYDRGTLDQLLNDRNLTFEQWGHQASVMPIEHFRILRHRWERHVRWDPEIKRVEREHPGLVQTVIDQVRSSGKLTVSDLESGRERSGPWWGYGPGKMVLEALFRKGQLAASRTSNFSRVYELSESAFPAEILTTPATDVHEAHRQLLLTAARAHGVGTDRDLADYFRLGVTEARPRLTELVESGDLSRVTVEGWAGTAYAPADAATPTSVQTRALLSPFDPVVWDRARTERLFGFHYRIEIYTPKPKRIHGYYVMPFLLGNQLVGRIDLKANRKERVLDVLGSYAEQGREPAAIVADLAAELQHFAAWLGLDAVRVHERGDLATELGRAIA